MWMSIPPQEGWYAGCRAWLCSPELELESCCNPCPLAAHSCSHSLWRVSCKTGPAREAFIFAVSSLFFPHHRPPPRGAQRLLPNHSDIAASKGERLSHNQPMKLPPCVSAGCVSIFRPPLFIHKGGWQPPLLSSTVLFLSGRKE